MSVLFALFVAQLLDPVRIILAFAATYWAFKTAGRGRRFTPLSIAILAVAALMSFLLSIMSSHVDANRAAISFVCGLFSTGVIVGIAALLYEKVFKL